LQFWICLCLINPASGSEELKEKKSDLVTMFREEDIFDEYESWYRYYVLKENVK
jgi:hypothetical protein